MLRLQRILPLAALAVAAPHLALAHAVLVESTPVAHQTTHAATQPIRLRFNSRVDGPHCTLALVRDGGKPQPLTLAAQPAPDTIAATAENLASGSYSLQWQALAADGHITRGSIQFTVAITVSGSALR